MGEGDQKIPRTITQLDIPIFGVDGVMPKRHRLFCPLVDCNRTVIWCCRVQSKMGCGLDQSVCNYCVPQVLIQANVGDWHPLLSLAIWFQLKLFHPVPRNESHHFVNEWGV